MSSVRGHPFKRGWRHIGQTITAPAASRVVDDEQRQAPRAQRLDPAIVAALASSHRVADRRSTKSLYEGTMR
jgi:hypothetical protein